ncbi:PAS domain S-box protein [Ideonella sp.]|uniref:PAS domain S-box protein n=1 Tax=Ideonella sp. TaxID=1929293 RepID=UPI002B48343F|nr:PAS domain S-box protein [Ideonella sp.]HJV71187.1 PAS domain S-box protein [Ideonella sp.]
MGESRWGGVHHALFNGNGVARRLLVAVVAFSTLITTLITGLDLYRGYQRDLVGIRASFDFVQASHAPTLSRSVWQLDDDLVQSQLEGLLRLPDVEYAGVEVDGRVRWSAGQVRAQRRLQVELPLTHDRADARQTIGTLRVVASVDQALARVWDRLLIEMLGNGLKTLLVAAFMLLVFQYLVTQHLTRVARFVRDIDPTRPLPRDRTLVLDRPATGRWRPDILDAVTRSINGLLRSLEQARAERDASHEQLARSELRLRLSVEAAGAGLWDCDLAQRVVDANDDCAALLGRRPGGLPAQLAAWREMVHPDDLEAALQAIQHHALQQSPRVEIECRLHHLEHGWRWMSVRGRVVERAADGAALRAVGTLVDVHPRMLAQAALREREERFRGIAEMNTDLVFQTDRDGVLRYVSPSARALYGLAPDDMTGQAFAERVAPEHRAEAARMLARVIGGETLRNIELSAMRDDGSRFPAEANVTPIRIDGAVTGAQGVLRDISERRRAEAAVRDNEARLRTLTAHTVALICELDAEGRVRFANRSGPPERPLVGTLGRDWVPPERRADFDRALQQVLATGDRQALVLSMPDADGAERHYLITLAATPGGGPARVVSTATDITELKQAEEALLDANRGLEARVRERTAALEAARDEAQRANLAKSEFLSRMSHELRTPMNAILGFAQILEAADLAPKQRRWAGEIHRAGEHLLRLIDELLDLARIEVGRLAVRAEPLELGQVLQDAVSMCQASLQGKKITLEIEPAAAPIVVQADPTRLRQILVNLVSNAIKYNRPGGQVRLGRQLLDDHRAMLTVSDTGLGIPADKLARLFVPFERLGREDSPIPGAGIGLALSKGLAELMGGELGVESTPGEGSTFWIKLPRATEERPPSPPAELAPKPVVERRLRVLYIEDNAANLELMETWFEEFPGFTLLTAEDGPEGIARARAERPDLILLDIKLPGMDGYEVLAELKGDERTRGIPVIAVSADAMPHDIARGKAAGFAAYVAKPIRLNELLARIDECSASVATPG